MNFIFQWAKIVVSLEGSVAQEDAHKYLQEYSIGLGPSDDPRYDIRAVMVIKSKAKTRAKQRKGALTNWKVCSWNCCCFEWINTHYLSRITPL